MIALLSGVLAMKEADRVVVKTASGVGYECFVPTRSLEALPVAGQPVELHTHLSVREDALTLFGFATAEERRVFQRLITVSGIGPKLALAMLSALSAERIVRAIREHDLAALHSVSGVGKKTAERVVLELKDKTEDLMGQTGQGEQRGHGGPQGADAALRALAKLGYTPAEADDAVRHVLAGNGRQETADLVRAALTFLSGR
jgi:Holliday junction DNA helicase RuvA